MCVKKGKMEQPIRNPIMSYIVEETDDGGLITVSAQGEIGGEVKLQFDNMQLLGATGMGFLDAAYTLEVYEDEGPQAAIDYVNGTSTDNDETTDETIEQILNGP